VPICARHALPGLSSLSGLSSNAAAKYPASFLCFRPTTLWFRCTSGADLRLSSNAAAKHPASLLFFSCVFIIYLFLLPPTAVEWVTLFGNDTPRYMQPGTSPKGNKEERKDWIPDASGGGSIASHSQPGH
jgi:hypothetical protein